MDLHGLRKGYHKEICAKVLCFKADAPNMADIGNKSSMAIANNLADRLGYPLCKTLPSGQTAGTLFAQITMAYLNGAFRLLEHLRPGDWLFSASQMKGGITVFDQYEHIAVLNRLAQKDKDLAVVLGEDYLVVPDIVIGRKPISDAEINSRAKLIGNGIAPFTTLRQNNHADPKPILHASISCKWTIRSDRSQNTRTEALNLIRNRKGKTPHITAITAEPLPTRIASLAMGTGDIDCVYHMALMELRDAIKETGNQDQLDMLETLIHGKRLRDVSDMPFDLIA